MNKILMSIISGMFFVTAFGMQKEVTLDVCIRVNKEVVFRRNDLDVKNLEHYGRFGMEKPLPFDKYFRVESALYTDHFNNKGYIEIEKDLVKHIPSAIYSVSLTKEEQKKLQFPQYISQAFIDRVKEKKVALVTIACNRENNTVLKLRYTIEEERKTEQVIVPAQFEQSVQNMSSSSSLLDYLHLFTEALVALSVMR